MLGQTRTRVDTALCLGDNYLLPGGLAHPGIAVSILPIIIYSHWSDAIMNQAKGVIGQGQVGLMCVCVMIIL